jgi:glycosyltransferase involved in cell wall biosynthesis
MFSADVIHIHNWYNLLSIEAIANIANNYPTIITMHDERIYTGTCHYSLECKGYLKNCAECPAVRTFKREIVARKVNFPTLLNKEVKLAVVAPSQWIIDRLNTTILGRRVSTSKCISNIIPIPDRNSEPRVMQGNMREIHLLFAAVNPEAPTKGLDILVGALSELAVENPDLSITLNIVGKKIQMDLAPNNLTFVIHGYLSQEGIGDLFKKVNLVVVPSRIDNSPSIISEAQLSGVLVLATQVGGIPELIEDSISGLLCEPNTASLKQSILRSIKIKNREEIIEESIERAIYRHSPEKVVSSHIEIYRKIISHE